MLNPIEMAKSQRSLVGQGRLRWDWTYPITGHMSEGIFLWHVSLSTFHCDWLLQQEHILCSEIKRDCIYLEHVSQFIPVVRLCRLYETEVLWYTQIYRPCGLALLFILAIWPEPNIWGPIDHWWMLCYWLFACLWEPIEHWNCKNVFMKLSDHSLYSFLGVWG